MVRTTGTVWGGRTERGDKSTSALPVSLVVNSSRGPMQAAGRHVVHEDEQRRRSGCFERVTLNSYRKTVHKVMMVLV